MWRGATGCLERPGLSFKHISVAHHRKRGPCNGLQSYPLQWGQVLKPLRCGTRTRWRSAIDFSGIAPGNNCSVRNRGILSSSRTIWVKSFSDQKGKSGCRHTSVQSGRMEVLWHDQVALFPPLSCPQGASQLHKISLASTRHCGGGGGGKMVVM